MYSAKVGDVARSELPIPGIPATAFQHRCPVCRCFVALSAQQCKKCGSSFVQLTDGYAQVVTVGR